MIRTKPKRGMEFMKNNPLKLQSTFSSQDDARASKRQLKRGVIIIITAATASKKRFFFLCEDCLYQLSVSVCKCGCGEQCDQMQD